MRRIKERLKALEQKLKSAYQFWPDDSDFFIGALGLGDQDKRQFERKNPDGSTGLDFVAALSLTAREDWADEGR